MRTKIVSALMVMMMVFSVAFGVAMPVMAGNTEDHPFSFNNISTTGHSDWRDKNDTTKVYVYPTYGPKIQYTVQAKVGDDGVNRSNIVAIPLNVQGSITNQVREKGGTVARLKFTRLTYAQTYTGGKWSPDSTKNYTIFN